MIDRLIKKAVKEIGKSVSKEDSPKPKPKKVKQVLSQVDAETEILAWQVSGRNADIIARVTDIGSSAGITTIILHAVAASYYQQAGHDCKSPPRGNVVLHIPDPNHPKAWYSHVKLILPR